MGQCEVKISKSKLLLAHEQVKLEVGKFYLVACAQPKDKPNVFVPVHPLHHKDPQFAITVAHYHFDGRFHASKGHGIFFRNGRTNRVMATERDNEYSHAEVWDVNIVYRRRKCIRETTGVMPPRKREGQSDKYWDWYMPYVGKSCKGRKCPHLGVTMRERDGVLECPLHGLIGNKSTEKIIIKENPLF